MKRLVAALLLVVTASIFAAADAVAQTADVSQAVLMLDYLRARASGAVDATKVDALLAARGTDLVILQQNISRRVSADQYRALLSAASNAMPSLKPADGGERARRGLEGLQKDVWPSLQWGTDHVEELNRRLRAVRSEDVSTRAKALAQKHLPQSERLDCRLFIVMGGRAGAAAVEGNAIYFDVLATSFRCDRAGSAYPSTDEIVGFFAHELHHVGLGQTIERKRRELRLSEREVRAFDFLQGLVMEGSASYLINGHQDLEKMGKDPAFSETMPSGEDLLKRIGNVLGAILDNGLNGEGLEKETAPFAGSGLHVAGAIMLDRVRRAGGNRAIMDVLRDPRRLVQAFNRATERLKTREKGLTPMDPSLDDRLARMGDKETKPGPSPVQQGLLFESDR